MVTCATRRLTPSLYPLLAKCLGPAVLPWVREYRPSMERGTALHSYLQRLSQGMTPAESLALVPEQWREDAEAIDLEALPRLADGLAEVALAWHPETGRCRVLGAGYTREQAAAACHPGEVPMVVDWLAVNGWGVLVDWKSGRQSSLEPAAENLQVLTYASVAIIAYGWPGARAMLCLTDHSPPRWDVVEVDALQAEEHLARVASLLAAAKAAEAAYAAGREPVLSLGEWCSRCPSQRACPAQVSQLAALAREAPELGYAHPTTITPEEAGALYVALTKRAKAIGNALDDIRAIAAQEPLPLPDGTTYQPRPKPRLDPAKAYEVLASHYGQEVADKAVPLVRDASLTDAATRAARALLPARKGEHAQGRCAKPTIDGLRREVRRVLEARGALALPAGVEE